MAYSINPAEVPAKTLADGGVIPVVGLGTFGSDHCSNDSVAAAVRESILNGYRHIDCASVYGNEKEIGRVINLDCGYWNSEAEKQRSREGTESETYFLFILY